jgi:hypothetical protein
LNNGKKESFEQSIKMCLASPPRRHLYPSHPMPCAGAFVHSHITINKGGKGDSSCRCELGPRSSIVSEIAAQSFRPPNRNRVLDFVCPCVQSRAQIRRLHGTGSPAQRGSEEPFQLWQTHLATALIPEWHSGAEPKDQTSRASDPLVFFACLWVCLSAFFWGRPKD